MDMFTYSKQNITIYHPGGSKYSLSKKYLKPINIRVSSG